MTVTSASSLQTRGLPPSTTPTGTGQIGDRRIEQRPPGAPRATSPGIGIRIKNFFSRTLNALTPAGVRADSKLRQATADFSRDFGKVLSSFSLNQSGKLDDGKCKALLALQTSLKTVEARQTKVSGTFDKDAFVESQLRSRLSNMTDEQLGAVRAGLTSPETKGLGTAHDTTLFGPIGSAVSAESNSRITLEAEKGAINILNCADDSDRLASTISTAKENLGGLRARLGLKDQVDDQSLIKAVAVQAGRVDSAGVRYSERLQDAITATDGDETLGEKHAFLVKAGGVHNQRLLDEVARQTDNLGQVAGQVAKKTADPATLATAISGLANAITTLDTEALDLNPQSASKKLDLRDNSSALLKKAGGELGTILAKHINLEVLQPAVLAEVRQVASALGADGLKAKVDGAIDERIADKCLPHYQNGVRQIANILTQSSGQPSDILLGIVSVATDVTEGLALANSMGRAGSAEEAADFHINLLDLAFNKLKDNDWKQLTNGGMLSGLAGVRRALEEGYTNLPPGSPAERPLLSNLSFVDMMLKQFKDRAPDSLKFAVAAQIGNPAPLDQTMLDAVNGLMGTNISLPELTEKDTLTPVSRELHLAVVEKMCDGFTTDEFKPKSEAGKEDLPVCVQFTKDLPRSSCRIGGTPISPVGKDCSEAQQLKQAIDVLTDLTGGNKKQMLAISCIASQHAGNAFYQSTMEQGSPFTTSATQRPFQVSGLNSQHDLSRLDDGSILVRSTVSADQLAQGTAMTPTGVDVLFFDPKVSRATAQLEFSVAPDGTISPAGPVRSFTHAVELTGTPQ